MRPTLENIELIEKYLNGELTTSEKLMVENKLQDDLEFKKQFTTQQDIYKAINRAALRKEIHNVIKPSGGFGFGKWIVGGLLILAAGISLFYFLNTNKTDTASLNDTGKEIIAVKEQNTPNTTTANNETNTSADTVVTKKNNTNSTIVNTKSESTKIVNKNSCYDFGGLQTWVEPNVQTYSVSAEKGELIEAENGTLIAVPSNAFVNGEGKLISGTVQLKIVEAINLEDIVLYNLGTTADGKPLQTGGMIHLEYVSNGEKVNINPARPIYIQVPTTKVKKDMQVFEGEVTDGKVNWKNPKPLKKYLINMDFNLLDFLPQGFSDAVGTYIPYKKHSTLTKKLVDSLYYSLYYGSNNDGDNSDSRGGFGIGPKKLQIGGLKRNEKVTESDSAITIQKSKTCGINPLSIKTIKTKAFEKTFLATKEFEERVRQLHLLEKGDELLKIYVNNLGKDLSYSDSLVANKLSGNEKIIFKNFEAEKLTNIKDAAIYQEVLSAYFNTKQKEFLKKQQSLATAFNTLKKEEIKKLMDEYDKAINKSGNVFSKAFKNSVQQNPISASASNNFYYSFTWAKYGWVNIDAYLHMLSKGSQKVQMNLTGNSGQTEVYQYLRAVDNLTPLEIKENTAFALVPLAGTTYAAQMQNTYCMAISKDGDTYKWFDQRYNPYQNAEININMETTDISTIRQKLRVYGVKKDLIVRLDEAKKAEEEYAKAAKKAAEAAAKEEKKYKEANAEKNAKLKKYEEALAKEQNMIKSLRKIAFKCENYSESTIENKFILNKDSTINAK